MTNRSAVPLDLETEDTSDSKWAPSTGSEGDAAKRKKEQNRIAQQNYRRKVKRRIESLEQQVAAQTRLLALRRHHDEASDSASSLAQRDSISEAAESPGQRLTGGYDTQRMELWDCLARTPEEMDETLLGMDILHYHTQVVGQSGFANYPGQSMSQANHSLPASLQQNSRVPLEEHAAPLPSPMGFLGMELGLSEWSEKVSSRTGTTPIRFVSSPTALEPQNGLSDGWFAWDDQQHMQCAEPKTRSNLEVPPAGASTQERLEFLLRCCEAAGFQHLEEALALHYTAVFQSGSQLSNSQRTGRRRRLPQLLRTIRENSLLWPTWEGNLAREEILSFAETLLLSEHQAIVGQSNTYLPKLLSLSTAAQLSETLALFQEESPNLSSLVACLLSKNGEQWRNQGHHSRLALVILTILHMAQQCPFDKISSLITKLMSVS